MSEGERRDKIYSYDIRINEVVLDSKEDQNLRRWEAVRSRL